MYLFSVFLMIFTSALLLLRCKDRSLICFEASIFFLFWFKIPLNFQDLDGWNSLFLYFFNLIFCFWIVDNWDFVCCIFRLVCQQNSSLNFYDEFAMILLIDRFSCCFCCKFEFSVLASQFLGKLKCKFLCVSVVFYFLCHLRWSAWLVYERILQLKMLLLPAS